MNRSIYTQSSTPGQDTREDGHATADTPGTGHSGHTDSGHAHLRKPAQTETHTTDRDPQSQPTPHARAPSNPRGAQPRARRAAARAPPPTPPAPRRASPPRAAAARRARWPSAAPASARPAGTGGSGARNFRANIMGNASHKLCEHTMSSHTSTYTISFYLQLSPLYARSAHHALVIAQHRARLRRVMVDACGQAWRRRLGRARTDHLRRGRRSSRFLSAGIGPTGRSGFRNLPIGQKRNSQFSSVTLASRIDPNFARIARNLPQPKFRKTLRETLAQGKGPPGVAV